MKTVEVMNAQLAACATHKRFAVQVRVNCLVPTLSSYISRVDFGIFTVLLSPESK